MLSITRARRLLPVLFFITLYFIYRFSNKSYARDEIRICQTPGCNNLVAGRFVRVDTVRKIKTEVCGLCWSKAEPVEGGEIVFRETETPDGPVFSTERWHNHRSAKAELGADGLWRSVPDETPFKAPPISEWPGQ